MEIISTEGYGHRVVYKVKEGDRIREIRGKDNLPPDVYMRWRRKTQRQGMQKLRSLRREELSSNQPPAQVNASPDPPAHSSHIDRPVDELTTRSVRTSQSVIDLTVDSSSMSRSQSQRSEQAIAQHKPSQTRSTDIVQPSTSTIELTRELDEGRTARDLLKCKVCTDAQVEKLIIPCGHLVMCSRCLTVWMNEKKVCPICREPIKDHFGVILI